MKSKKEKLIEVSPKELCNWIGHDRHEFELDTEQTINSLLENGQTTPIIVRPYKNSKNVPREINYEIIDGECRWHAAKQMAKKECQF